MGEVLQPGEALARLVWDNHSFSLCWCYFYGCVGAIAGCCCCMEKKGEVQERGVSYMMEIF